MASCRKLHRTDFDGNAGHRPRALSRTGWLPAPLWGAAWFGARRVCPRESRARAGSKERSRRHACRCSSVSHAHLSREGSLASSAAGLSDNGWRKRISFRLSPGMVGSSSPGLGKRCILSSLSSLERRSDCFFNATFAGTDRAAVGALPTASSGGFSGRSPSSRSCRGTQSQTGRSRKDKSCSARSWVTSSMA